MKDRLYTSNKIEVRKSPLHGYGVFAKEDIKFGELLEECHIAKYTKITEKEKVYGIDRIKYTWPKNGGSLPTAKAFPYAIALGYGSIYNSSTSAKQATADWETDMDNELIIFTAINNIKKDEEILIYYYAIIQMEQRNVVT